MDDALGIRRLLRGNTCSAGGLAAAFLLSVAIGSFFGGNVQLHSKESEDAADAAPLHGDGRGGGGGGGRFPAQPKVRADSLQTIAMQGRDGTGSPKSPPELGLPTAFGRNDGDIPSHIYSMKNVIRPVAWELLHEFFGTPNNPIKLHVYDIDVEPHNPHGSWDARCGLWLKHCNSTFGNAVEMMAGKGAFGYCREFGSEILLSESISRSKYHVDSAEDADFVFVQSCVMGRGQGQYQTKLLEKIQEDPVVGNRFKDERSSIVLTLAADHGTCHNRKERRGGESQKARNDAVTERWFAPGFEGATMMQHEGSLIGLGCYDRRWASTIPTAAASFPLQALSCDALRVVDGVHHHLTSATIDVHSNNKHSKRPNLVFFSGKNSAGVRKQITAVINKEKLSVYEDDVRFDYPAYLCAMRSSVFCFAPRGNAVWSPRLEEALAAGCIPIIVADGYDLPFNHILDYRKFSVRLRQSKIQMTHQILASISEAEREVMREHGKAVLSAFRYAAGTSTVQPGQDATSLVAFQLWVRAKKNLGVLDASWDSKLLYFNTSKLTRNGEPEVGQR